VTRPALRPLARARSFARWAATGAVLAASVAVGLQFSSGGGRVVQAVGELGAGGEYHPITPTRLLDTRQPAPLDVAPFGRKTMTKPDVTPVFEVQIAGRGGLPAYVDADADGTDDNVLAVAVSITVVNPTATGYLQAWGSGAPEGTSSLVNFYAGEFVPNMAILRPGQGGKLSVRLAAPVTDGTADVVIDVFGWFSSSTYGTPGARVVPAGPGRIFDSREVPEAGPVPVGAGELLELQIRGADASSPAITDVVPDDPNVVGVLVNITGINNLPTSAPTFVSALPDAPAGQPTTSNLNLLRGQVRSVLTLVPLGADGRIRLYNGAGDVHLAVDVVGYLKNGADPATRSGRVVPLVAPFRAFDTREAAHGAAPLPPAQAEIWSFEDFINDVRIGAEPVGPQLGLLGNLTATDLGRQYPAVPIASFLVGYPPPAAGQPAVPEVSNITIREGQTMPNLALIRYGADTSASPDARCTTAVCVQFYNLNGYLHYLLDVSAVILADA
jgi:hypothetical protein